ncbi:MAG: LptF/LptG family permease [Spirochaetales bacterium]|nr:LptF/LptG family permease [Spirochaetales bacterium]
MTKGIMGKALFSVFITYVIAFIFYAIWMVFFPPVGPLPNFVLSYSINQAFINIIDNFIALTALALMLAYSLLYSNSDFHGEDHSSHFHKIVKPVLILIIVLAVIYTLLIIWVHPLLNKSNQDIQFNSQLAKNYLTQAEKEFRAENYNEAIKYLDYSLNIDKDYKKALNIELDIRNKMKSLNITFSTIKTQNQETMITENSRQKLENEASQFMGIAHEAYLKEDFFTAYYNAKRAFELDPTRIDADELSVNSMNHISDNIHSIADEEQQEEFKAKIEGYNALFSKDSSDYIKAYYIFKNLQKKNPDDPDIQKYLKESSQKINHISFFLDEIKNINHFPGYNNILFINSQNPREIISITKMIMVTEGIYFQDIEVLTLDSNNNIQQHLFAPYGKFIYTDMPRVIESQNQDNKQYISLNAIDRENPNIATSPQYFVSPKNSDPLSQLVHLHPPIKNLPYLQLNSKFARSLSLVELNTARDPIGNFGYSVLKIEIEFLSRLLKPFMFLIICFFAIGLGWFLRSRYLGKPPIIQLFMIPLFPFVINFIINLLTQGYKVIISFFVISSGLWPALIAGIAILIVLMFLSIIYLASQIIE